MKYRTMVQIVTCFLATWLATTDARAQCAAPKVWFPHEKT
jgi:hypothetical protein